MKKNIAAFCLVVSKGKINSVFLGIYNVIQSHPIALKLIYISSDSQVSFDG
ncbi:hypothetical protein [Peribacillus sp. TH24]|uniref:hypothetical protein n=1 Tax=Peribacillus sp. TH24 TaxID=2798483 RepID=UPI001911ED41|nr:hypothetical protein [Peribacillus sp. TH24]MBK5446725.1 hypothetical protein [Peribacillus sp. TH24]